MDTLHEGQSLGPYRIIDQIGQGGMATVYKAYHAAMDRYVALKVLPSQLALNPEFSGRFRQEARTIAKLEHARILPVYDYGESDGLAYLVMRHLDAGTLKERLSAGALTLSEVDHFFAQLTDALDYAHTRGVIHRDLKPSNVLLDARGDIFLTDFGIAKLLETDSQFTGTGGLIGTPAYMSPEQAQGQKVDRRSDIYSLGIILYEMVTGRVPYEAETPLAVILKHLNDALPLPSTVKPGISPNVERVILKALAKNPNDRFATVADFLAAWREALTAVASGREPSRGQEGPGHVAAPAVVPSTASAAASAAPPRTAQPKRPSPWRKWAVGCGLAGVVGFASLALLAAFARQAKQGGEPTAAATETAPTAAVEATDVAPPTTEPEPTLASDTPTDQSWTSWTAGNTIYSVAVFEDLVFGAGPGGVSVWNRHDGVLNRRFTTADGLPSAWVNFVYVQGNGPSLWVGTAEGLARYDGEAWTTYTVEDGLDSNTVTAMADVGGRLVAGTAGGPAGSGLMVHENGRWMSFPGFPSTPEEGLNQLSTSVTSIARIEDQALWVGTTNGLGRFDGQKWRRYSTIDGLPSNHVTALLIDEGGTIGVGTTAGMAMFDGARFRTLDRLGEMPIFGILQDSRGGFWVSGSGAVARLAADREGFELYSSYEGLLPVFTVYGMAQDTDGNVYFGTEGGGLMRFAGEVFETWIVPDVTSQPAFSRIVPASRDELWFVQEYGYATDRYDGQSWSPLTGLACDYCAPLAFDSQGGLWAGSDLGLWAFGGDGEVAVHLTVDQGLPSNQVTALAFAPDGQAWIGTDSGVAVFDGSSITGIYTSADVGLAGDYVRALLATSDGSMWVATNGGASRMSPDGAWEHYAVGNPFTDSLTDVTDLAEAHDGSIWLSTWGDGAYSYAGGTWQRFLPGDAGDGPPSYYLNSVTVAPDGSAWFGGYLAGAVRFDGRSWSPLGVVDGLIHANVNDVWVDEAGRVWFATSGGVTRYVPVG